MVSRRVLAVVAALACLVLLAASRETLTNKIVLEFSQDGADVVVSVSGSLSTAIPSSGSPFTSPCSNAGVKRSEEEFEICCGDSSVASKHYSLTLGTSPGPFPIDGLDATATSFTGDTLSFLTNIGSGGSLFVPEGQTEFQSTSIFEGETLDDWIPSGSAGLLASYTIDNHGGLVEIRIAELEPDRVLGDPHFFVGRSLYDWKQVGVYDHLVFADHAVTLEVEDFAGCDGEVSGEFILGLSVSGTSWTASCDGIYDANTGELVAKHRFTLTTPCVTATVLLTNGYLNLHNITTSCKVEGGVHKAMTDHASSNVDGWWEWTEAGGFELKDKSVPKVTPLVKKPRVISIDI